MPECANGVKHSRHSKCVIQWRASSLVRLSYPFALQRAIGLSSRQKGEGFACARCAMAHAHMKGLISGGIAFDPMLNPHRLTSSDANRWNGWMCQVLDNAHPLSRSAENTALYPSSLGQAAIWSALYSLSLFPLALATSGNVFDRGGAAMSAI